MWPIWLNNGWVRQFLKKITADESKVLAAQKDNRKEINKICDQKFNLTDTTGRENKDKCISLLSVMNTY